MLAYLSILDNTQTTNMKYTLIFSIITFLICSCGSKKVVSPDEAVGKQLILSHGGGFTGKYNTYFLLENGQLFKNSGTAGVNNSVKSLSNDVVTQIFSNYTLLGLDKVEVETYGNLLYSITMKEGDKSHRVSWEKGDKGSDVLQLFYRNVMNQISVNNSSGTSPSKSDIEAKF